MKGYFAYVRVSTTKQGEQGVSLPEQRAAIERFAQRRNLPIAKWFEDQRSAAVRGRPAFTDMLRALAAGKAQGVIIHKIDRSARNLRDWAELGDLVDRGIELHSAHDALDLQSRGGRLSADLLAVVAADFVRNNREEAKKGMYGRLKQGLYPRPAPLGYLDQGKGRAKAVDPVLGPLVREAFELYSTGRFSVERLTEEMHRRGLRARSGRRLRMTEMAKLLHNTFYTGVITIKKTGQTFAGVHPVLVASGVFGHVQQILRGRAARHGLVNAFAFRRLLTCGVCEKTLIGERQKGRVYYRCHTAECPTTTIREDAVDVAIRQLLQSLTFTDANRAAFKEALARLQSDAEGQQAALAQARQLKLTALTNRTTRLTDAYLDGSIDEADFQKRKTALLMERREMEEVAGDRPESVRLGQEFLELANRAAELYERALPDERQDLLKIVTSNRCVDARKVNFTLRPPFCDLVFCPDGQSGAPVRGTTRTRSVKQTLARFAASVARSDEGLNAQVSAFLASFRDARRERSTDVLPFQKRVNYVPVDENTDRDDQLPVIQVA